MNFINLVVRVNHYVELIRSLVKFGYFVPIESHDGFVVLSAFLPAAYNVAIVFGFADQCTLTAIGKPEALFLRMILASSNPGDTVLDPFAGSGTSLRVCQQTGRNAIGIDINPEYTDMMLERLAEPFDSFDSSDARNDRVPGNMRREYSGQISIFEEATR